MSFKGNKVWAEVSDTEALLVNQGKVRIKYSLNQDYEYQVSPDSLGPESCAVPKQSSKKEKKAKTKAPRSFLPRKEPGPPAVEAPPGVIVIYTDGASSGNPGPAGIGALLLYGGHEKELSESIGTATNNVAELTAIKRALEELKRMDLPVEIHTDSSYCIGVLTKGWKPNMNSGLISEIRTLMNRFSRIRLIKTKGHSGIPGNERADSLATAAVKK
ncbi:MAG: ribonuclease HI [Desulfobacteraceae bacterium]|nr:ribonuclease HI [Desulfobacteraceae bacterium]